MRRGTHGFTVNRKRGSLHAAVRLYCSQCRAVKAVTDTNPFTTVPIGYLECGHARTAESSKNPGKISLEELSTPEGQRLFRAPIQGAFEKTFVSLAKGIDAPVVLSDWQSIDKDSMEEMS